MKYRILILMAGWLFVSVESLGQSSEEVKQLLKYDYAKLESGNALLFSLLLPGGGCIYADREGEGAIILAVSAGSAYWLVQKLREDPIQHDQLILPIMVMATLRVADIVLSQQGVESYNAALRKRLNLTLEPSTRGFALHASLSL